MSPGGDHVRARPKLNLIVAALVSAAFASILAASSAHSAGVSPTLYVNYSMDCTFTIVNDSGLPITSIAPGNYQVDVRTPVAFGTIPKNFTDMTACRGMAQFQLTGPGVSYSTTLTAGCEADDVGTVTFQPSATYVAQDMNQPTVAHASFTTQASGTAQKVSAGYVSTSFGKGTASTDIVGSGLKAVKGTLVATLTQKGMLSLTRNGKPVSKLAAGRYTFAITDGDKHASFGILGPKTKAKQNLTGAAFVGKKQATLALTPGRWTYLAGLGQIHFFLVTS